jgi:hypothetical protein
MTADVVLALVVSVVAAGWLVFRAVRAVRGKSGGGCGCAKPTDAPCPGASAALDAARAGAARRARLG